MPVFQTYTITPTNRGLFLGAPPHRLEAGYSPSSTNVRIRDGYTEQRPGTGDFNDAPIGIADGVNTADMRVMGLFLYPTEQGGAEAIAITGGPADADRYFFQSTSSTWSEKNAVGPFVIKGTALEPYDATVAPTPAQTDVFYASNGVADLTTEFIKWTGTGDVSAYNGAPGPARTVTTYANRLVIGYIYDGVLQRGLRVGWSGNGDAEDWTSASSGQADLIDTPDFITRLLPIRGGLVIYKENSIFLGRETGNYIVPIAFQLHNRNIGAIAGFSVAAAGDGLHFFLGDDNVYAFDGSTITPIGDAIRRDLRNINRNRLRQVFSTVDPKNTEYRLFVPEGTDDYPKVCWVYNWREQHWNRWETPELTAGARVIGGTGLRWQDIQITGELWSEVGDVSWGEYITTGAPTTLVGNVDLSVDEMSERFPSDSGAAILSHWDSQDIDFAGQPSRDKKTVLTTGHLKTLARVQLRYRGTGTTNNLVCKVSGDGGNSYQSTLPSPASLTDPEGVINFDLWMTSTKFRIRLENNQITQGLPGISEVVLHYLPGPQTF